MKTPLIYDELTILREYSNDNRTRVVVLALTKDDSRIVVAEFDLYKDPNNKMISIPDGCKRVHDSYRNTPTNLDEAREVYNDVVSSLKSLIA